MEGDVANIPAMVELAKKYDASLMIDEAHGIGVFGEGGRGLVHHYGLADDVDLIMGTFSKSFSSLGGFIATNKEVTNYLRHHSRSYIFTASITPASTAAALKALEIMQTEPERQEISGSLPTTRLTASAHRDLKSATLRHRLSPSSSATTSRRLQSPTISSKKAYLSIPWFHRP